MADDEPSNPPKPEREATWSEQERGERKQLAKESHARILERTTGFTNVSDERKLVGGFAFGIGAILLAVGQRERVGSVARSAFSLNSIGLMSMGVGTYALAPLGAKIALPLLASSGSDESSSTLYTNGAPTHRTGRASGRARLFEFSILNKRMRAEADALEDVVGRPFWFPKHIRGLIEDSQEAEREARVAKVLAREKELSNQILDDLKSGLSTKLLLQKLSKRAYVIDFNDYAGMSVPTSDELPERPEKRDNDKLASTKDWVSFLRESVALMLEVASPYDQVVVKISSPGGTVSEYGLAAAELLRLRRAGIKLTVCVDTVCASGGYMMAACADKVVAAPFAMVGSIGVVAEMPNFHRVLDRWEIDYLLVTAGKFKRTVHPFGEITDESLARFKEQLEDVHDAFKSHVHDNRPGVDEEAAGSGEAWLAMQAKQKGLVDELKTSDEYLLELDQQEYDIVGIKLRSEAPKRSMGAMLWDLIDMSHFVNKAEAALNAFLSQGRAGGARSLLAAQAKIPVDPGALVSKL